MFRSDARGLRLGFALPVLAAALALSLVMLAQPVLAKAQSAFVVARPLSAPAGTVFHFRGSGFGANETVSTIVRWPDGSEEGDVLFQANADGVVDYQWDSRGALPGRYVSTATGQDSGRSGSAGFIVQ